MTTKNLKATNKALSGNQAADWMFPDLPRPLDTMQQISPIPNAYQIISAHFRGRSDYGELRQERDAAIARAEAELLRLRERYSEQ